MVNVLTVWAGVVMLCMETSGRACLNYSVCDCLLYDVAQLYRSTVNNPNTGKLEHAKYRVAKSAWLEDSDADVIGQVSRRIFDLTGLSLDSELLYFYYLLIRL